MNFTTEIKREIMKNAPAERSCRLALLSAVLRTCGERRGDGFSFTSENEDVAAYLLDIAEKCFGARMTLTAAARDPKHGRDKLTFSFLGEHAAGYAEEILIQPLDAQDCALSFLKGAYLGGGSCTLPRGGAKTGYHLEFVFPDDGDAELFLGLLDGFQLFGGKVRRGEKSVVYCKSREGIGDFLSVMEATSALKTLEQVSAAREENNRRNRVENCTAGNVDRSLTASAEQVRLFVENREKLGSLPSPLKETAIARIEHPTLSLQELADLLAISKGGLSHRLRRLTERFKD